MVPIILSDYIISADLHHDHHFTMSFSTPTRTCQETTPKKVRPLVLPDEEIRPLVFHEEEEETTPVSTPSDLWDWPIRRAYTIYTLEDVTLQENIETLERWLEIFTPSSQPRNEEEGFYIMMMQSMIESKLELLKCLS